MSVLAIFLLPHLLAADFWVELCWRKINLGVGLAGSTLASLAERSGEVRGTSAYEA